MNAVEKVQQMSPVYLQYKLAEAVDTIYATSSDLSLGDLEVGRGMGSERNLGRPYTNQVFLNTMQHHPLTTGEDSERSLAQKG